MIEMPLKKEESSLLVKEINDMLDNWLSSSQFTKEDLIKYKTYKIKIKEERRDEFIALGLIYKENGIEKIIGAPVVAYDSNNLYPFYQDAYLLFAAISNILDKSNRENPVNGSFTNNYFSHTVSNFFENILKNY